MRVAAVVLAAGKSQRMGRNKLLLELGGIKVLDRVLSSIEASRVDEVIIVLGHNPDDLRPIVEKHIAKIVLNADYEEGMTASFKAGLRSVTADAVFLCLGDQAVLDPALIDRMIDAITRDQKALIVSPVHGQKRGHPVLFRDVLFPDILELGKGKTLKDVVDGHSGMHIAVESDVWCTLDMDTPEDFIQIRERLGAGL